jgi:hypothetical protein
MNETTMKQDFIVMPMKGEEFEVILGKDWLSKYNPDIDWKTNELTVNGQTVKGIGRDGNNGFTDVKVCSLATACRAARRHGSKAWAVLVTEPKEEKKSEENNKITKR